MNAVTTTAAARPVQLRGVRRRPRILLAALTGLAMSLSPAAAIPANAAATQPFGSAFLLVTRPANPDPIPAPAYQWNSRHANQAVNRVNRTGAGTYTVHLPDLGATSGTVLVTAFANQADSDPNANYCKVGSWGANGTTQDINVVCFNKSGQAADTPFALSYRNVVAANDGYLWASEPSSASYTPSLAYQANSTGAVNTITRSGAGVYQVKLPNLGASAGHVQVTGYGSDPNRCKVSSWGPTGADQIVTVRCFTPAGAPVDAFYTLTYVRNGNVIGGTVCCHSDGHHTAYAWANLPTTGSYTPATSYQFADFGSSTVNRLGVGHYQLVTPVSIGTEGNAQVTAYGTGSEHCKLSYWGNVRVQPGEVAVRCWDTAGNPVDTLFDVSYVGPYVIG